LITNTLLKGFEKIINGYLRLAPESLLRLTSFSGKTLAVELKGLSTIYVIFDAEHVRLSLAPGEFVAAEISGTPLTLFRMMIAKNKESLLFSKEVVIKGDVEWVQQVSEYFETLDIDWEEHLSRLTGDVVAHQIGHAFRQVNAWGQKAITSLRQNTTECLQEEWRCLPPSEEMSDFMADVDVLRNDAERLAARVERLIK
jgi:ubiquinone biosynthesis protein UbiJ